MILAPVSTPIQPSRLAFEQSRLDTIDNRNTSHELTDATNDKPGSEKISMLATHLRESKSTATSASEAAQKDNAARRTYVSRALRFGTTPIGDGKKGEQFVITLPIFEMKRTLSAIARTESGLVHLAVEIVNKESPGTVNGKKHEQGQSSRVFLSPDAIDMSRTNQTVRLVVTGLTDFKGLELDSSLLRNKRPNPTAAQPDRTRPNENTLQPMGLREVREGVIEHDGRPAGSNMPGSLLPAVMLANGQLIQMPYPVGFPTRVKEVSLTSQRTTLPVSGRKGELIVTELPPTITRQIKEGVRFELQHSVESGEIRTLLARYDGKWYLVATADTDYQDLTIKLSNPAESRRPQQEAAK